MDGPINHKDPKGLQSEDCRKVMQDYYDKCIAGINNIHIGLIGSIGTGLAVGAATCRFGPWVGLGAGTLAFAVSYVGPDALDYMARTRCKQDARHQYDLCVAAGGRP